MTLNESPADKTSGIRNMDLSSLATGMTDITNAIVNTIPALMTDLNALQTQINTANTAASIPDLTISPNTATNAEKDEALADYKTELTAISAAIQAEKDLLLAINNTCTTLLTNIVSLNDTAVRTNVTALTFQPKYEQLLTNFTVLETQMKQALNNTLPAFKSSVLKFVAGLEGDINVALNCRIIAVDLDAIENAVCGDTLSALDAVWLAMIYLGMLSMLSMPIVIWSANVLYPLDRNQIHDAELIPSDEDQAVPFFLLLCFIKQKLTNCFQIRNTPPKILRRRLPWRTVFSALELPTSKDVHPKNQVLVV